MDKRYPWVHSRLRGELKKFEQVDFDHDCVTAYDNGYHDCIADLCYERDKFRMRTYGKLKNAEHYKHLDRSEIIALSYNTDKLMKELNKMIAILKDKNKEGCTVLCDGCKKVLNEVVFFSRTDKTKREDFCEVCYKKK
jgi:hypothetical protein